MKKGHEWANFKFIVLEIGGTIHQTKGIDSTRMKVRIRDAFTCQSCGDQRTPRQLKELRKGAPGAKLFDVHHLNGECGKNSHGYDRKDSIKGLVTLCHKCHYNHHQFSKRLSGEWFNLKQKVQKQKVISARNAQIAEDAKSATLQIVGEKYGISRERVRQICVLVGVQRDFHKHKKVKPPKIKRDVACLQCSSVFKTSHSKQKFCSRKCQQKHHFPSKKVKFHKWYNNIKENPSFKELVRRRNAGEKGLSVRDFVKS